MKVIYTGPHEAVDIPAAHVQAVRDGEPVEVPKEIGDALVAGGDFRQAGAKASRETTTLEDN